MIFGLRVLLGDKGGVKFLLGWSLIKILLLVIFKRLSVPLLKCKIMCPEGLARPWFEAGFVFCNDFLRLSRTLRWLCVEKLNIFREIFLQITDKKSRGPRRNAAMDGTRRRRQKGFSENFWFFCDFFFFQTCLALWETFMYLIQIRDIVWISHRAKLSFEFFFGKKLKNFSLTDFWRSSYFRQRYWRNVFSSCFIFYFITQSTSK